MITIELTEDEALSLRNLLDVAVRHEGMRAPIFVATLDAKKRPYRKPCPRQCSKIKMYGLCGKLRLRLIK